MGAASREPRAALFHLATRVGARRIPIRLTAKYDGTTLPWRHDLARSRSQVRPRQQPLRLPKAWAFSHPPFIPAGWSPNRRGALSHSHCSAFGSDWTATANAPPDTTYY